MSCRQYACCDADGCLCCTIWESFVEGSDIQWASYDVILVLTSTYGSGAAPSSANRQDIFE